MPNLNSEVAAEIFLEQLSFVVVTSQGAQWPAGPFPRGHCGTTCGYHERMFAAHVGHGESWMSTQKNELST